MVARVAGQAIGVTTAGSATDAAAHLFLKQFNMLDSVQILPAGGTVPAILAAMGQGNIAGGVLSPPTTSRAADAGYTELVNGAKLGVPMNHSGIAVRRGYLKDHPDEVKNFLSAYQEAWMYAASPANKAEVVAVLVKYTQSDDRLADSTIRRWCRSGLATRPRASIRRRSPRTAEILCPSARVRFSVPPPG